MDLTYTDTHKSQPSSVSHDNCKDSGDSNLKKIIGGNSNEQKY